MPSPDLVPEGDPSPGATAAAGRPGRVKRAGRAFGHFWWDFLIGDTPELFVAVLVIVGVVAVLAKAVSTTAAWAVVPVLVIAALTASVLRGRRG